MVIVLLFNKISVMNTDTKFALSVSLQPSIMMFLAIENRCEFYRYAANVN